MADPTEARLMSFAGIEPTDVSEFLQLQAAEAIGLSSHDYRRIIDLEEPRQYNLGELQVDGADSGVLAIVNHAGNAGQATLFRGGCGFRPESDFMLTGYGLCRDMRRKALEWGLRNPLDSSILGGNKIILHGSHRRDHLAKIALCTSLGIKLARTRLIERTSTAGDIGTNHEDFMDAIADGVHQEYPAYRYWQGAATGTSEKYNGYAWRKISTGTGVGKKTHDTVARYQEKYDEKDDNPKDVTFKGGGAVGAWAMYEISRHPDQYRIVGIDDLVKIDSNGNYKSATYHINDLRPGKPGIKVTKEMAATFADDNANPSKIVSIAERIEKNQPDLGTISDKDVTTMPTYVHVAASIKNTINEKNANGVDAKILIPGANRPESLEARLMIDHRYAEENRRPLERDSDTITNGFGTVFSQKELAEKYAIADGRQPRPESVLIQEMLEDGQNMYRQIDAMANLLGVNHDVAAAAIGLARVATLSGVVIDEQVREMLAAF